MRQRCRWRNYISPEPGFCCKVKRKQICDPDQGKGADSGFTSHPSQDSAAMQGKKEAVLWIRIKAKVSLVDSHLTRAKILLKAVGGGGSDQFKVAADEITPHLSQPRSFSLAR
jgi:hypothetical protein